MNMKNLLNIKKIEEREDKGLGCYNRVLTKETTMYCRVHGFQNKSVCKCQEYNKF